MREIDAQEFAEWKAAYAVQPWGDDWAQADLMTWAACGGPKITPGHFLPVQFPAGVTATLPSTDQLVGKMQAWLTASGVNVINGN